MRACRLYMRADKQYMLVLLQVFCIVISQYPQVKFKKQEKYCCYSFFIFFISLSYPIL